MYDIKLGSYKIKTLDEKNIALIETKQVLDPQSKRYGESYEKVLGYYTSFESALDGYNRRFLNGPDVTLRTIQEVILEIRKIRAEIKNVLKGCEQE